MKELFDKKFVHFIWDDSLEGKEGFFANMIDVLEHNVNSCNKRFYDTCLRSDSSSFVFNAKNDGRNFLFFYYDPNYEVKWAYYKEGKIIQLYMDSPWGEPHWDDCVGEPDWDADCRYRIKPEEEKKWVAYLNRVAKLDSRRCYLTACREDKWEDVQKDCGAKTKLFVGAAVEVTAWYEARQKFAEVIKAWEEGKEIEYQDKSTHNQWENCPNPMWLENVKYRVKLEETVDLSSYLKPKKWVKFNLNHYIEVKLNEEGERIYAQHFAKTALHLDSMKNPDENGYRSFQMHEFMEIFGNHFGPSAQDIPCDMDVLIEVEE